MESLETNLQSAEQNTSSRRAAILMGGAALAGLAFTRQAEAQTQNIDNGILNFALNLEYLEATFFTLATSGTTIDVQGAGVSGLGAIGTVTTKNSNLYSSCIVPFTNPLTQQFANELAIDERTHVNFLRTTLGVYDAVKNPSGLAVSLPNIDLYNSFNTIVAAVNTAYATANPSAPAPVIPVPFDPFGSETNFLLAAMMFEDVGVSAYAGAATLLTSKTYLAAAAGILATEAYHNGSVRTRIFGLGASAQTMSQALAAGITAFDYTGVPDVGVGVNAAGQATVVDADSNAIAFARSTEAVRAIVYGGGSSSGALTKGGFFPNGMNGSIT